MTVTKKLLCGLATLTILISFSSCSGCESSRSKEESRESTRGVFLGEAPVNPKVEEIDHIADNAILVTIDELKGDDMNVTELSTGEKYTLNYSEADKDGNIKGSLSVGASLSILPNSSMAKVVIAINVDQLSGKWIYEESQHRGLVFEKNGSVSSINSGKVSFREWKLKNGKLYIYFVNEEMIAPERNEFLVEEANILSLSDNRLMLDFRGETYDCHRQSKKAQAVKIKMN